MQVKDSVVVVTGAGRGIGAALASRFAQEGAAAVIVSDIDTESAERMAAAIGGTADTTDVSDETAVTALVERTLAAHGRIDLFCSNAGVFDGGGLELETAVWQQVFAVNVLAHVYAARAVLPSMLERGQGYLLNIASAAGLLSAPGNAPYTVTKHGALSFAEWLALTYGDRGISVSAVCPLGVATPMLLEPDASVEAAAKIVAASGAVITPDEVAEAVIGGLADERFLILPHPEVGKYWARKAGDPDRWLSGVRRLISATVAES